MARIEKVSNSGVLNWLRHDNRTIKNDNNKDIDPSKTYKNDCLTPYISKELRDHYSDRDVREEIRKLEYAKYKELKKLFYCYNRKDVNTLVSVVVTCPKEITDPVIEKKFFQGVADFLNDRYGNTVSITIHRDEGKHYVLKDKNGNPILDENQKPIKEWHEGRSHLHYNFIPTVKIDKEKVLKKKNPVKAMLDYEEKINAKERIDRKELLRLHPDMNYYLNKVCGIKCNLNSGITARQGGNKTVEELKREFDETVKTELMLENERLRGEIKDFKTEIFEKDQKLLNAENRSVELENLLLETEASKKETNIQIKEKDITIEKLQNELSKTKDYVKSIENELSNINNDKTTIEQQQKEIETLKSKNADLEARISTNEVSKDIDNEIQPGWGQSNKPAVGWGDQTISNGWNNQEKRPNTWDVEM